MMENAEAGNMGPQETQTDQAKRSIKLKENVSQFSLNHPKNYFGVVLAIAAKGETGFLITENLVTMGGKARDGAEALGLITQTNDLTELGKTIAGMVEEQSSVEKELNHFCSLKGSSERFIEATDPHWEPIAKHVLQEHTVCVDVVQVLESTGPVSLAELAAFAIRHDHDLKNALLRNPDEYTAETFNREKAAELKQPDAYSGQAVYQFKNLLYHCGVLTERGADTSALVPQQDLWKLDPSIMVPVGGGQ